MTLQKLYNPAILLLLLAGGVVWSACSDGCEQTRETHCVTSLTSESGYSITSVYAWGIGQQGVLDESSPTGYSDTLMLEETEPEELYFVLRPDTTATQIRLQMRVSADSAYQVEDTLTIHYQPRTFFLSMDCGCSVFFTLKEVSVTRHFLRSASIQKDEITNTDEVNVSITY